MDDKMLETLERELAASRTYVGNVQNELAAIAVAATLVREIGGNEIVGLADALTQAHNRYNESIVQPALRALSDISRGYYERLGRSGRPEGREE